MSPEWPLETERLTLRPFVENDFREFADIHGDPELARWLYNEARGSGTMRARISSGSCRSACCTRRATG